MKKIAVLSMAMVALLTTVQVSATFDYENEEVQSVSIWDPTFRYQEVEGLGKVKYDYESGAIVSIEIPDIAEHVTIPSEINGTTITSFGNILTGRNMKSVTVPSTITSLEYAVFANCENLETINLPSTITVIPERAFSGCISLTNYNIESTIKTIETQAFEYTGIKSIEIPVTVTKIGNAIFANSELEKISFENGFTTVDIQYFKTTKNLKEVIFPNTVTTVDEFMFQYYTNLESVTLPSSLKEIPQGMFYGCTSLETIIIPSSVTSIGSLAFKNSGLVDVEFSSGLKEIGDEAFAGLGLTEIVFPSTLETIGKSAFYQNSELKTVKFNDNLKTIGEKAFSVNEKIETITLPKSLTSLGNEAFSYCGSLKSVDLTSDLEVLPYGAFQYCYKLQSVVLPTGVKTIYGNAFYDCLMLQYVNLPRGVKSISNQAFGGCKNIEVVFLPATLTSVGSYAFDECEKITDVYYDDTKEWYDSLMQLTVQKAFKNATIHYNSQFPEEYKEAVVIETGYVGIYYNNKVSGSTLVSGSLPKGVSISENGVISGVSVDGGTYEFSTENEKYLLNFLYKSQEKHAEESDYEFDIETKVGSSNDVKLEIKADVNNFRSLSFNGVKLVADVDYTMEVTEEALEIVINGRVLGVYKRNNQGNYIYAKFEENNEVKSVVYCMYESDISYGSVEQIFRDAYGEAVWYVYKTGIMNGTSDVDFSPNDSLTRAMMVTILYRMAGSPEATQSNFVDVEQGSWYEKAVNWALETGITSGTTATTFKPSDNVTNEQVATFLSRYCDKYGIELGQSIADLPEDFNKTSDFAKDHIKKLYQSYVYTSEEVNPTDVSTRNDVAVTLTNLMKLG